MADMNIDFFESRPMIKGEVRKKGIVISRVVGTDAFTIDTATYTLTDEQKNVLVPSSSAMVANNEVSAFIDTAPLTPKNYILEFTYSIGAMVGKARLKFKVVI